MNRGEARPLMESERVDWRYAYRNGRIMSAYGATKLNGVFAGLSYRSTVGVG